MHVEDDVIRRRYNRIFDIHFRLRDTADFVTPYFTIGILNNAGNPWEVFQGFILHVHVEGNMISRRYDRNSDINFRLRDMADYVPHSLLWGILNNAGSPIKTKVVLIRCL